MRRNAPLIVTIIMLVVVIATLSDPRKALGSVKITITDAKKEDDIQQGGYYWYNEAWHYRRPVTIINSGDELSSYQVLIKLDSTNFDFNKAKADGTDLRITEDNGKNPRIFWIESWDKANQLAYIWVLTGTLIPEPGKTTLYLYYGNPEASPIIDETSPFDFFDDDWTQFVGGVYSAGEYKQGNHNSAQTAENDQSLASILSISPRSVIGTESVTNGYQVGSVPWEVIYGTPTVQAGELILNNSTGIKTILPYQYQAVGFRANFGSGAGNEWGGFINGSTSQRAVIGDLSTDVNDLYLRNFNSLESHVLLPRVGGNDWHGTEHIYEVRWCNSPNNCDTSQTRGLIDHGVSSVALASQVPGILLPVTFYNNNTGAASTLKIDWVYVRQYREPEPTAAVGEEQGLVELAIDMVDYPDPVRRNEELSYSLTIENNSPIDAPSVVLTDTLPQHVQYVDQNPACNDNLNGEVVCNFGNIPSNSSINTTIVVIPNEDELITNTVVVSSPGYEFNLNNNADEEGTLVDSVPPVVNWEKPVHSGENYSTLGGTVTLEASAIDYQDQVARVEFIFWDHISQQWVNIGNDTSSPYQVLFDSKQVQCRQIYQMSVVGIDRAGNRSNPYNPLQIIYFERLSCSMFFPFAVK